MADVFSAQVGADSGGLQQRGRARVMGRVRRQLLARAAFPVNGIPEPAEAAITTAANEYGSAALVSALKVYHALCCRLGQGYCLALLSIDCCFS